MNTIHVEKFNITNKALAEIAFAIREEVFVQEQQVSREEEYDEFEAVATHFLAYDGEKGVATARWRKTPNGIKLERFAVLKPYRGRGYGEAVLNAVLQDIAHLNEKKYLHAQIQAVGFYSRAGFEAEGPLFSEANIDHYKMVLK